MRYEKSVMDDGSKIFTLIVQYLINTTNSNIGSVKGYVRFLLLDNIRNIYFELNSIRSFSLYCGSCHIKVHLKKLSKLVYFSLLILTLMMEENKQNFFFNDMGLFKKDKNGSQIEK